jgi:hypothetical protein
VRCTKTSIHSLIQRYAGRTAPAATAWLPAG